MEDLIKEILKYGLLPTFLLIIIFLIIQDPDRIIKLKAIITEPFYKVGRWFSKSHISSKVSSQITIFFKKNIYSLLVNPEKYNFKIKWVDKTDDPIFQEDGTLIIRLKEEKDQVKNILTAVHVTLPHILFPIIRHNLSSSCIKSIDLAVLQKLANKLGKHGKATFKRYFLEPETNEDKQISELLTNLLKLDKKGFFVPIFLNELEYVEDGVYADNDMSDYTHETINFINYLLSIVNRNIGEEIELNYLKSPFKIGTILLAKAERANTQGLRPYIKRLGIKLDKGCESVYIISYPPAFKFFDKLINTLQSHERIFLKKIIYTNEYEINGFKISKLKIAVLRRNDIYSDDIFQKQIDANNIEIGKQVKGRVEHISQKETLVEVLGMRAYINIRDASWHTVKHCADVFKINEEYNFEIKSIDKASSTIYLTRKMKGTNPWDEIEIPKLNDIISVHIISYDNIKLIGIYQDKLEVYIPLAEISWFWLSKDEKEKLLNKNIEVKIIDINFDEQKIFCSIKRLEEDPWPQIHKALPKGTEMTGRVIEITKYYVDVKLPNGYKGRIPKEALEKAGYEYKNFEDNLIIGQGIEVVVTKVFIAKQKIRLDLKRNIKNAH